MGIKLVSIKELYYDARPNIEVCHPERSSRSACAGGCRVKNLFETGRCSREVEQQRCID